MKFTKEQQDFLKHCGEHFEVLTGGRGHSKTKEVIEDLQQELERYKNIIDKMEYWLLNEAILEFYNNKLPIELVIEKGLNKLKELKGE